MRRGGARGPPTTSTAATAATASTSTAATASSRGNTLPGGGRRRGAAEGGPFVATAALAFPRAFARPAARPALLPVSALVVEQAGSRRDPVVADAVGGAGGGQRRGHGGPDDVRVGQRAAHAEREVADGVELLLSLRLVAVVGRMLDGLERVAEEVALLAEAVGEVVEALELGDRAWQEW